MIKNDKIFFKTFDGFVNALQNGQINQNAIVFVKDRRFIWTHGTLFSYPHHIFLTQDEYDALESYEPNALYFIVEQPLPDDIIIDKSDWHFGDTFPITFGEAWKFGDAFPIKFKA